MTNLEPPPSSPPLPAESRPLGIPTKTGFSSRLVLGVCASLLVAGLWLGFRPRNSITHSGESDRNHLPVVAVAKVERENLTQTLSLSAEFRPYQQVALHAKIAGYLQTISVDVGDHVSEGQAIAQLDVPELQNELEKVTASLGGSEQEVTRAEASYAEVHLACTRLQEVAKGHPKLVAQQEVDTALARDAIASSAVAVARQKVEERHADVARVNAMRGYMNIVAPFDGVITKRFADPGALIQAGTASNTQAMPVVDIAENKRLRLSFPVPESAVPIMQVGASVKITIGSLGETLDAKASRFSGKVDRATRTMATEVDIENSDGRLKPGMIAEVLLVAHECKSAIAVPVQALSVGERPTVLVIGQSESVGQRAVKLGLQTPTKAEVLEGLQPGDLVLVGSRNGIQPGQKVAAKLIAGTE